MEDKNYYKTQLVNFLGLQDSLDLENDLEDEFHILNKWIESFESLDNEEHGNWPYSKIGRYLDLLEDILYSHTITLEDIKTRFEGKYPFFDYTGLYKSPYINDYLRKENKILAIIGHQEKFEKIDNPVTIEEKAIKAYQLQNISHYQEALELYQEINSKEGIKATKSLIKTGFLPVEQCSINDLKYYSMKYPEDDKVLYNLGCSYFFGMNDEEKKEELGLSYLYKACELNNPDAKKALYDIFTDKDSKYYNLKVAEQYK